MENAKLFLSQKSQLDFVEKIKNKNKKRTRASLSQSSEDVKQENFFMWPKDLRFSELRSLHIFIIKYAMVNKGQVPK